MSDRPTGIWIIPPFVYLAAILLAWPIYLLWPAGLGLPPMFRWPIAALLIVGPVLVGRSLMIAFRRVDSKFDVRKVPNGLVTDGLYRFSRNPGYLCLIVIGIGVAVLLDNLWTIVLLVPATLLIRQEVVLKEEAILEREFGDEYRRYKQRVRRWL